MIIMRCIFSSYMLITAGGVRPDDRLEGGIGRPMVNAIHVCADTLLEVAANLLLICDQLTD